MNSKTSFCPVEETLKIIAGRWKVIIIHHLLSGPKRFNALQRSLGGITHRTLIKQLRELEENGLVNRNDYRAIPPRVDYSLTELGFSLKPVLMAMHEWGEMHEEACRNIKSRAEKGGETA